MEGSSGSASRQLFKVIWPLLLVVVFLMALAAVSLGVMSSVRAYIGGESFWSKGQKDAVLYLDLYAQTGDAEAYRQYQRAIAYPLDLKQARLELDSASPDFATARAALISSGVYPGDVSGVIWVFGTFRHVSYFDAAVRYWARGDEYVDQLVKVGNALHAEYTGGAARPEEVHRLARQIWQINEEIAPWSRAFSDVLSASYRKTTAALLATNAIVALILIALAMWHARRLILQSLRAQEAYRRSEARATAMLGAMGEAVVSTALNGTVEFINPAAERLVGVKAATVVGRPVRAMFKLIDEENETPVELAHEILSGGNGGAARDNLVLIRPDGGRIAVQAVSNIVPDEMQTPAGVVLVLRSMVREREFILNLAWQATHDGLTGLWNRTEYERRLALALEPSLFDHESEHACAVMLLDLDQFKVVNDTFGHAAGDTMLREVAARFQTCLRDDDMLARLGGDEFGVLLRERADEPAEAVAERLRASLANFTWHWASHPFSTSVSIGVVSLVDTRMNAEEAMRFADIACYLAKERGRDRVHIANLEDQELTRHTSQISWGRRIKEALEENRLCLYAQPIQAIHGGNGKTLHAELLLRMTGDDGEIIGAGDFIPAAERYGLMPVIDRWVVRTAFEALAASEDQSSTEYAINLSGASIGDERFLRFLREQFAQTRVAPSSICFEITETAAVANLVLATRFIHELKRLGCKFALDDFGAGMSSFAYLRQLPVDYLKIDGSFVKDMASDSVNHDMVAAINDIGHSMGRKTIAEYVENEAIMTKLREVGVDFAQGYYIGKPTLWLAEHKPLPL
jgi:diguanylate cyclase (GGDEF)-like protein/PAS domain S-box-containing protein